MISKVPEYPLFPKSGARSPAAVQQHLDSLIAQLLRTFFEYGYAVNQLIDRFEAGPIADRPSAGNSGFYYFATDEQVLYHDDGTQWVVVGTRLLSPENATDTGTDAYASAATTATPAANSIIIRDFQSANTTTTPTLDGVSLVARDGSSLWAGALNRSHYLLYDGTNYRVLDAANQPTELPKVLYARGTTGTQILSDTFADVNILGESVIEESAFSLDLATSEITIKEEGLYDFTFEGMTFINNGDTGRSTSLLRYLVDDGSGYAEPNAARSYLYNRTSGESTETTSLSFLRECAVGDKLKFQAARRSGGSQIKLHHNSRLIAKRLR